jgi:hypothetical protein
MDSLKQLVNLANDLLKGADVGREYTMEYVVKRLESALDEYPHDPVIRSVATVLSKQFTKGKLTTSQKELYATYNHFAGLSANSMIKDAIGDLLYPVDNNPKATVGNDTAFSHRSHGPELDMNVEHNPLENLFDKNVSAGVYYDPTLAKLGKHAIAEELTNIGVPATDIKVVAGVGDNQAIVYDAIFTNKLGTAHVPMFIEVKDGVKTPTHFYGNSQFVELTAENLNKYIVEKAQTIEVPNVAMGGVRTASSVISPLFAFEEDAPAAIELPAVPMPEALKDLASFENALLDASTNFTPELVRTAKAICHRELANMGFRAQVSLAEATDNCIICSAELDSAVGKVEIKLPVEIADSRAQIPALFYNEGDKDKIYDFSKAELTNYLTAAKADNGSILRYSNDFFNMSYNQLKEEMIAGAVRKDYVRAEAALNRIEDKFGSDYHRAALSDYARYLTLASADREEMPAQHKCRLMITKGSFEPRCGHYNVPMSRVATDERGNCELLDRKAKYENLAESSGALLRSNKITLT